MPANPLTPHPGTLTLGYGGLLISIYPTPADPHVLCCATKALDNISREIVRAYVRPFGAIEIKEDLPKLPRLWLRNTVIELEPHHIAPAQAWCHRYADWLRAGDIGAAA